jgi:hypothetical protein
VDVKQFKFWFFLGVLVCCGVGIQGTTSRVTGHHFKAYIIQNGIQLPIEQHVVKLKRAPFQIVVDMPDKEGVFISASFNSGTYKQALKNVSSSKLNSFSEVAIYELWKNPNNELFVEGTHPQFWFIDSPSKSRFNSYEKVNGRYICNRSVDHFYDMDAHIEIPVSETNRPLFLTFIKFSVEGENYRSQELMRHSFKVEWED